MNEINPSCAELLGRAYAAMVCAAGVLKANFRAGQYGKEHYEALEEELARLSGETMRLAKTLGWVRKVKP